jgi:hypothetical protein
MAGGEYPRSGSFTSLPEQFIVRVPVDRKTIREAIDLLGGSGVVEVSNSSIYNEPTGLTIAVNPGAHIELRAADGCRPTLNLGAEIAVTGGRESSFDLNGIVVAYQTPSPAAPLPVALLHAPNNGSNQLSHLGLTHCTLVPGWALTPEGSPQPAYAGQPALAAEAPGLRVAIQKSITGGLWVSAEASAKISDSVVDATDPSGIAYFSHVDPVTKLPQAGGALTLLGCTVVGKVYASLLSLVSDSMVWAALSAADKAASPSSWRAPLWASRKQQGCVRFSYLPPGSITSRRFKCLEQAEGVPQPLFLSMRYGDPSYAKLAPYTDDLIRRGADDDGEMGAFHFLLAPLRENDLLVRIQEFIPVGLEFGVFYET